MEEKENNGLVIFLIAVISILLIGLMVVGIVGVLNNRNTSDYETQSLTFENKSASDTIELTLNDSDKSFDATNTDNFEELDLEAEFGLN